MMPLQGSDWTYFDGTLAGQEVSPSIKMSKPSQKEKIASSSLFMIVPLVSQVLIGRFQHVGCNSKAFLVSWGP